MKFFERLCILIFVVWLLVCIVEIFGNWVSVLVILMLGKFFKLLVESCLEMVLLKCFWLSDWIRLLLKF